MQFFATFRTQLLDDVVVVGKWRAPHGMRTISLCESSRAT